MNILALDLGTSTGWASGTETAVVCGTKELATKQEIAAAGKTRMDRRLDPRVPTFFNWLCTFKTPECIVYEDVLFSSSRMQTQLWAAFRTAVWLFAYLRNVVVECLNTASLKLYATGNGAATKPMMGVALKKEFPTLYRQCDSEDAVDAAWLWVWGQKRLARGQPH